MWFLRVNGARSVKISIRLLCRGDLIYHAVNITLELRVRLNVQRISGALNDFVDIGVVEGISGRRLVR